MISAEKLHEYSSELFNDKNKSEVVLRNAARTAYYALYHKILSLNIPQVKIKDRDGDKNYGSHESLIIQLRASDNESHRKWALDLSRLKSVRHKADYKLSIMFPEHDAYSAVRKVGKLLQEIDESEVIGSHEADTDLDKKCNDNLDISSSSAELKAPTCSASTHANKVLRPTLKVIK